MKKTTTKAEMPQLLASSSNPSQISAMFQGVMLSIVPIVIQIMQTRGIEITQTQGVDIVQAFTACLSLAVMTFGGARKAYNLAKSLLVTK